LQAAKVGDINSQVIVALEYMHEAGG